MSGLGRAPNVRSAKSGLSSDQSTRSIGLRRHTLLSRRLRYAMPGVAALKPALGLLSSTAFRTTPGLISCYACSGRDQATPGSCTCRTHDRPLPCWNRPLFTSSWRWRQRPPEQPPAASEVEGCRGALGAFTRAMVRARSPDQIPVTWERRPLDRGVFLCRANTSWRQCRRVSAPG